MKGNGKHKIPPIYADFEIKLTEARIGDMIIERSTGKWSRIKEGDKVDTEIYMIIRY